MSLTPEDWIAKGYRKHDQKLKSADFLLQKLIDDEVGKRYYITVYVYDRSTYPHNIPNLPRWGYMPEVQFRYQDGSFANIDYNSFNTIEQTEKYFERLWIFFGKEVEYYDEYD